MLQLKIVKGPAGVGRSFPLVAGKSVTIGRAENCEVRLPAAGISKTHCRLTALSGSKATVEDLGSSNGTFVNGLLVKKHALKPGDTLTVSDFTLSVGIEAPQAAGAPDASFDIPSASGMSAPVSSEDLTLGQKVSNWLALNVFPWADKLSTKFDVRVLVGGFFVIWSILIILMTVSPFATIANERVRDQSVEVARLYARQIVQKNQQAVIEQRYRDLVTDLDLKKGQTPGLLEAMILDVSKAQILAPTEMLGRNLPNKFAFVAITKDTPFTQFDSDGVAYVSEPIRLRNSEGAVLTVATVLVAFDAVSAQFSFASLLDQAVTSLLYALFVSILLFVFLYRWVEGSLLWVAQRIDEALKGSETSVSTPVQWPALAQLCEMASAALAKAAGGASAATVSETDWAVGCVNASPLPAGAFDANLVVIAWNTNMERIIGIRASMAIGSDISGASRDVAFEAAIRELSANTLPTPWNAGEKKIEFSGRFYKITMVSGNGASFVTIHPAEE